MTKKNNTKQSLEIRERQAKKYIKDNIWKQIGKQKIYELGIIPTILASIWYVPYWVGLLAAKAIGHDNYLIFINALNRSGNMINPIIQDTLTRGDFYFIGFFTIIILAGFIAINFGIAISRLKDRAQEKFNVSDYDLSDFRLRGDYS
jgi:hypothetical protein